MRVFVLIIIGCVTLCEFLVKTLDLPNVLKFIPELTSGVVALYVLIAATRGRLQGVAPKYWLVFLALTLIVICGAVNSAPGTGAMLSGARFYLRALPMFFLAAVLPFSATDLKRELRWLLAIALFQVPLSAYQRYTVISQGRWSGDDVRGTLIDSGILSIVEICAVAVLTGFLLRGRIGKMRYALLFFALLIPTAIDETKATLLFLPFILMVTLLVGAEPAKRLRYVGLGALIIALFGAAFIPVYNVFEAHNHWKQDRDITDYFTNQKKLNRYLSSNVTGLGTKKDVRRGDALTVPLQYIAKDPAKLAFGLGMGAVSPSNFGKGFEGPYFRLFNGFLITSLTFFMLELGVLGTAMIFLLLYMVFDDSRKVARLDDGLVGALASAWAGVAALMAIAVAYTLIHEFTSVTYLFAYFSGVICTRKVFLAQHAAAPARAAARVSPPVGHDGRVGAR